MKINALLVLVFSLLIGCSGQPEVRLVEESFSGQDEGYSYTLLNEFDSSKNCAVIFTITKNNQTIREEEIDIGRIPAKQTFSDTILIENMPDGKSYFEVKPSCK